MKQKQDYNSVKCDCGKNYLNFSKMLFRNLLFLVNLRQF